MKSPAVLAGSLVAACVATACSPPHDTADARPDATLLDATLDNTTLPDVPEPQCDAPPAPFATGSAAGHPTPLGAGAGEARAGRVTAAQLPADRTGLAIWRAGDFVLANHRVAVLIEDARASDLHDPWGGKPVGLARVEGGRLVDAADFGETFLGLGRFIVATESVTVLRDGAGGGPAVVRAVGPLRPIPFLDEFGRSLAPANYGDLRAALDYTLAPDADELEVTMTVASARPRPIIVPLNLHAFFQRSRMPRFVPGAGFAPPPDGPLPFVAFVDDEGTSYAWAASAPGAVLNPLISVSGFDAFEAAPVMLEACAHATRPLARVTLGGAGRGLDGLVQSLARARGVALRAVRGAVTEAGGAPAAGVRVHARSADGRTYLTRATTDATGAFALHVPLAQPVQLVGVRAGDTPTEPVTVAADATSAALALAPAGTIRVRATDDAMRAVPARVTVVPAAGAAAVPALPASLGEPQPGRGRLYVGFATDGAATVRAPAGRWSVIVSRGFEHEIAQAEVTVRGGETVDVPAVLRRSVDTSGALCGDFHVHTSRSPDAADPARLKVAALAAEGLELAVRSDHEYVADFAPLIAEMNLGAHLFAVPSLELTTFTWGHFGVVPFVPDPTRRNGGAIAWFGRTPASVFDEVRALPGAPTIIVNHPRGNPRFEGYFQAAELDPATGRPGRADLWDTGFTAVEVFNDSSFEQNRDGTVRDWFGFLRGGRRVFAVGSSDSHQMLPDNPVGYPRTCLRLGTDDPRATTQEAVRDAVARGRSVVSGGVYVTAEVTGRGPGEEVTGAGATATARVTVQAPAWIAPERLEVLVDGATVQTIAIDATTADPGNPAVRLRRDVTVPVAAAGSFVVFAAHASRDLAPLYPGRTAFGVTNPIFLQR